MAEQIVIGYDGSQNSDRALEWAIREAAALPAHLQIVASIGGEGAAGPRRRGRILEAAEEKMATTVAQAVARAQERGVTAAGVVARGDAVEVLLERSATASELVLGKRGRHGVRGRMGLVSAAAAARAKCPVVVLPGRGQPEARTASTDAGSFAGRVVVGMDRIWPVHPAIVAAARYAVRHGRGLTLLTVVPEITTATTESVELDEAIRQQSTGPAQAMVDQVAEAVRAQCPGLSVATRALLGFPAIELVEATRSAVLVVVGSRGYGGVRSLLMGSVSQAVLTEGESPVMIVPTPRRE